MSPMRLAFCMSHPGYARNFESTLRELDRRGHEVTVLLERPPADGLLESLAGELPGLRVQAAPPQPRDGWSEVGCHLRAGLDYLRFLEPPYHVAAKPRARAASHVPRVVVRLAGLRSSRPAMRRILRAADRAVPLDRRLRETIVRLAPDALLLTPLVDLGSPQLTWLRAARSLGVPTAACMASWDNLTMRGGIHEQPELLCVWNAAQAREATELHGIPEDRIAVTGAVAYDHWFAWRPRPRAALLEPLGLDPARAYLLYVGSSPFIAPDEPDFVREWAERVRAAGGLSEVQILVRPHPLAPPSTGQRTTLEALGGLALHPPAGADPTDATSRADYFDALHHAAAVAGVNTSALVESAVVGTVPHTVLAERYRATQGGTLHFGHLRPETGGPLAVARDWDEHTRQLAAAVAAPPGPAADRLEAFVSGFVRPLGRERAAAPLLADAVERVARAKPVPAPGVPPAAAALAHAARLALRTYVHSRPA